jgi:hypothetical protein
MRRYNLAEAMERAWPILIEAARMGRTLTYTELAGRAGPPLNRRNLHRQLLIPLSYRCRQHGLPDLSALVVRRDTGLPGGGWFALGRSGEPDQAWVEALEACFLYRWPLRPDPRWIEGPTEAARTSPAATNTADGSCVS